MENYKIKGEDGEEYIIDRSIGVSGFIFKYINNDLYILANRRCDKISNHKNLWNCPCGHLDFDETLKDACVREIEEECGIYIKPSLLKQYNIEDSPSVYKQNVTHRFYSVVNEDDISNSTIKVNKDEVGEIMWINIKDIEKYNWAFNHNNIINDIVYKINDDKKIEKEINSAHKKMAIFSCIWSSVLFPFIFIIDANLLFYYFMFFMLWSFFGIYNSNKIIKFYEKSKLGNR